MRKVILAAASGLALLALSWLAWGWLGPADIDQETSFIVPSGATLIQVAERLEKEGHIGSANGFLLRARLLGSARPIQAGEFLLEPGMSESALLARFQSGDVIRRFVTIPEGMPSIMVHERLMANPLLTGTIDVPEEGSVLPDSYAYVRGQSRADLLEQMQQAMKRFVDEAWEKRKSHSAVGTKREALILASIVEKETGVPSERRMVAGLYSNRLRQGMRLQADPTIIYPITKGKPLGRRIRRSEIEAVNGYNTYSMAGLPEGPITNPGRESILAVLDPAPTDALYMVADGKGGHVFARTLAEHQENVRRWYALRRARGEM